MSNSVFQSVIIQLKDVTDRVFGVIDTEGCVVSCTDMSLLGERWSDAALKVGNSSENRRASRPLLAIPIISSTRFSAAVMTRSPAASAIWHTLL